MKILFYASGCVIAISVSTAALAQAQPASESHSRRVPNKTHSEACDRCEEITELDKKVLEERTKQEPNTAAYDVEAAKIINSLGKLSSDQSDVIARYLLHTLPTDPAQAMIESIWPSISKNWDAFEKAAKKLPSDDADVVWIPIQHYANSLKHGQDRSPPEKSKK